MSATTSGVPRRHHTNLQPVATSHESLDGYQRGVPIHSSATLTNTSPLPSPSLVAARAYYLESTPPIGQNSNALRRRRSLIEAQLFPRRHSVFSPLGGLATKMESFKVSSPAQALEVVPEKPEAEPFIKTEVLDDASMAQAKQNNMVKVSVVATSQPAEVVSGSVAEVLRQVPFEFTHNRLRDWGYAYLGNTATADAFINAVSLRRPSLALAKDDVGQDLHKSVGIVTIRARVLPRAKERKPFLLQRQFDIKELRKSIPPVHGTTERAPTQLRRSVRTRRSSAEQISSKVRHRRSPEGHVERKSPLGTGAVPIHVEYALHYLPVLAALMLSGHVRKGDSIDLPVPCPEAWRDMMSYIYTGKGTIGAGVKENILYLAGYV